MSNKILVLGSTGKTGKRVAARLQNLQVPIRLGSRNGQPAFNWDDSDNWQHVLTGIEGVYITFQPDLAVSQSVERIKKFSETAKVKGVKKLVLLSGRGEAEAQACEQIIINAGTEWTILRASWFMQNFSEAFLLDGILERNVVVPKVLALEPFVDADDIADVAVQSLIDPAHNSKIYELTGPDLLSFKQVINLIANAIGTEICFQDVSMESYVDILKSIGTPDDFVSLFHYLFTEVLDGRNESVRNDIEQILHRPASNISNYIEKTITTNVWNHDK